MQELYDLGNGMSVCKVDINRELREQDLNARIMSGQAFSQLVKNIKKRGGLESLPYCVKKDDVIEIVSGHHRIRACREAGITEIPVLLDTSKLTRSQIVAKQLAHNSIVGEDDKDILRQLYEMMDTIDDKLESFIDENDIKVEKLNQQEIIDLSEKVDFKTMTFVFTSKEFGDVQKVLERLGNENPDAVGVASNEDFKPLVEKLNQVQKDYDVKSVAVAMHILCTGQGNKKD